MRCGHCSDLLYCSHVNGSCLTGCKPGYEGKRCQQSNDEQVQGWKRIKLLKKNTEEIMMFPKRLLTKRHLRSLVKLTNQKSMNHVSKLLEDKQ